MGQNTIKAAALRMSTCSLPEPPGAFFDLMTGAGAPPEVLRLGDWRPSIDLLRTDAARLAGMLDGAGFGAGFGAGGVLAVQCRDPLTTVRLLYASLWLGCALFPLEPGLPPARRDALLRQAGAPLLVTDGDPSATAPTLAAEALPAPAQGKGPPPSSTGRRLDLRRIQLIIATSGTSGEPKGVMLSRLNLWRAARSANRRLGLGPGDRWLACLPLFHIGGLSIFYRALLAGAGVAVQPGFRAEAVWQALRGEGISHLSLVPPMLERLLGVAEGPPPSRLRVVLVGGGPLAPGLAAEARQRGWPLCVSYGLSEAASQVATDCGPQAGAVAGRVGRPLPGVRLSLTEGHQGRIRLRGRAVMAGYLTPGLQPGSGLGPDGSLLTGDLGRLDPAGVLHLRGRADDLLVSAGRNIHPAEVEALLLRCPGVAEVAVTGEPAPLWGQRLVAWYRGGIPPAALESWARQQLPGALRPRRFEPCTELPRNALGKIDRARLRR
jgi:o-succinylbenzoate---CoA ligase